MRPAVPGRGRPIRPENQKPAASKLADYRVQVAAIEYEVKKLLGTEDVTFVEIPGYLTIARRILGELRRAVRGHDPEAKRFGSCPRPGSKQGTISDYVKRNRLNPELAERIRELVIECYGR